MSHDLFAAVVLLSQEGKTAAQLAADNGFRALAVMLHNRERLLQCAAEGGWGHREECVPS